MKEPDRVVVTGVLGVLLLAWLGFLLHRSPRFPGSGVGAVLGIAGAVLMLVPLAYPIAKRIPFLHDRILRHIPLPTLLAVHVYAGILGPLLAILHTGHKFDSLLGLLLTAAMLLVVVSGFVGRYLLSYSNREIKDKLLVLQTARGDLDNAWGALQLASPFGVPAGPVTVIAESVADLEYAVRTHELFKRWCSQWLWLHLILSVLFYGLLALHIGSGIYFGLRWLQ